VVGTRVSLSGSLLLSSAPKGLGREIESWLPSGDESGTKAGREIESCSMAYQDCPTSKRRHARNPAGFAIGRISAWLTHWKHGGRSHVSSRTYVAGQGDQTGGDHVHALPTAGNMLRNYRSSRDAHPMTRRAAGLREFG
jgi:hypothetical protein